MSTLSQTTSGYLFSSQVISNILQGGSNIHISWGKKIPLFPRKVIIQNDACNFFFFSVIHWALQSDVSQMRLLSPSEQPDFPCNWCNPSFNSRHTRVRHWVGLRGRGREVMFAAAWRELALREREMIWSCADSWDHNARLPAAAWQIQKEGKSDTERHLQTANTPSSLLIISNWASGSN